MNRPSLGMSLSMVFAAMTSNLWAQETPLVDNTVLSSISESVKTRDIESSGFKDFKSATSLAAVSPAFTQATKNDLVAHYDGLMNPSSITAVVLKPRIQNVVYQVPAPPEDGRVFDFLKEHFQIAAARGASFIRLAENETYTVVPRASDGRHLKLEKLQDVIIDFNGSTLELTQVSLGILFSNCQRVVVKNGKIRGVGLLASIAKVVHDDSPGGMRLDVLPEYVDRLERNNGGKPEIVTLGGAEKVEGSWRYRIPNYSELFVNRGVSTNNFAYLSEENSFVSTSALSQQNPFANGSHIWLQHYNNHGMALLFDNEDGFGNSDITIEDFDFINIPGMVVTGEIVRGLHLKNISISVDKNEPQAFLGAASDGIHINANGGDIVIENCDLGPNADDKITIKGNYWKVTKIDVENGLLTIEPVGRKTSLNRWGWKDQKAVFVEIDYSVVASTKLTADSVRENSKRHVIQLAEIPDGVQVGSLVGNVDNAGGRVVIRNNQFSETRAQGILVQTSHVVIENNHFSGIAGPAIKLNVALSEWYESINVNNVLIRSNRFARCSMAVRKPKEVILLNQFDGHGKAVDLIDNVRILGNVVE